MKDATIEGAASLSTEQRLKEAAVKAFGHRGYTATSIREIAKDAGLTIGSLYHYASGKEELFLQLVLNGYAATVAAAREVASTGGGPTERLLGLVEMHVRGEVAERDLWRMSRTELNVLSADSQAKIIACRDAFEAVWTQVIREGCESGEFWPVDETVARISVIRVCTSVGDWFRQDGRLSLDQIVDVVSQEALGLLRPQR